MNHISPALNATTYFEPVTLFSTPHHQVYWVGAQEDTPFRCNAYLIVDGEMRILIDPGSQHHHFDQVRRRVAQVVDPSSITHIIVHHQDPDLCDSLPAWLALNPQLILITTPRTRVLLPYYGFSHDVQWLDASPNDSTILELPSGSALGFITAPFLHFPEAMTTFDEASGFLLTGDIGAAIEREWQLVVEDWERHWRAMVPFHVFYMASQRALQGYLNKVRPFPLTALLPQHGSIIPQQFVEAAFDGLSSLPCGIDLLYPASNLESAFSKLVR